MNIYLLTKSDILKIPNISTKLSIPLDTLLDEIQVPDRVKNNGLKKRLQKIFTIDKNGKTCKIIINFDNSEYHFFAYKLSCNKNGNNKEIETLITDIGREILYKIILSNDNTQNSDSKKMISKYLLGSESKKDAEYEVIDSIKVMSTSRGLGVIGQIIGDARIINMLFSASLAKAYEKEHSNFNQRICDLIADKDKGQNENQITNCFLDFSTFILKYYFKYPFNSTTNEIKKINEKISREFCINEEYEETINQLKLIDRLLEKEKTIKEEAIFKKLKYIAIVIALLQLAIAAVMILK